jgi:hypothetical protein
MASSAFAQNPPPPSGPTPTPAAAEAERVIVTGSNIPTAEEVGPNPVLDYNRDYIEKSGGRTTEQFLLDLHAFGFGGKGIRTPGLLIAKEFRAFFNFRSLTCIFVPVRTQRS